MKFAEHESVVLVGDRPDVGLRKQDLGVVVHAYQKGGLEVEFIRPDGRTHAVVTLDPADVRTVRPTDIISVREAAIA